ncbi:MAG TPA: DUF4345 domain-containing protein [Accumulibacter sp.]|jgi:hypothetical protein|nr:DUF4345 domain-containing protein [Accumulibacter sp.]
MRIKQAFLILAFIMVSIIALLYGVSPQWFARTFLGVVDLNLNVAHILRAVMGLYLGLGLFWLFAVSSTKHRNTAVLTTVIFAAGLASGRMVSLVADGIPSPLLVFYTIIELALVPVAYWVYRLPE